MAIPTLTVYMASGGKESDGGSSTAGHMYYVLTIQMACSTVLDSHRSKKARQ